MTDYYAEKLSAERLRRCYEIASPRVKQYLEEEINFFCDHLKGNEVVLELGCGYGRVAVRLAERARLVIGIDNSIESIKMARELAGDRHCRYLCADAVDLCFEDNVFDTVVCVQNGVCIFRVDRKELFKEALRVTKAGGKLYFSTYSDKFWNHRLKWFEAQAEEGLLGEIDHDLTGNGTIVCRDGFSSGRMLPDELYSLCEGFPVKASVFEIDESSVFLEVIKEE